MRRTVVLLALIACFLAPAPSLAWQSEANSKPGTEQGAETTTEPEETKLVWSPYGYVKLDASLDSSQIDTGNFARWVSPGNLNNHHTHFNLTVRQTRLGIRVMRPSDTGPTIGARVEIDFYGGGAENKNVLQLRHAYIEVDWAGSGWRLIGGQTCDIISPLLPRTLNYTVAWWVGNIGYRRPLLSITKRVASGDASSFVFTAGISRTIGDGFGGVPGDSGTDSGHPSLQSRLGYDWSSGRGGLGVSGHWGEEDATRDFAEPHPELQFDSWSLNADLKVPLGARLSLRAEAWTGENLDDYFGGINQGINLDRALGVRASGGWFDLQFDPTDRLALSAGAGIDNPQDDDLEPGARSFNRALWGNVIYDFTADLSGGFELSHWRTVYIGRPAGDTMRLQASLVFKF